MAKTGKPDWLTQYVPPKMTSKRGGGEQDTFVLFYIDDVEYRAPVNVSPAVGLRVLMIMGEYGLPAAILHLMKTTVGEAALDALANCDGMEKGDLSKILAQVQMVYMGQVREMTNQGN